MTNVVRSQFYLLMMRIGILPQASIAIVLVVFNHGVVCIECFVELVCMG